MLQSYQLLAAVFQLDYMFFEQDTAGICGTNGREFYINLFNCYFYGCLCPCQMKFRGRPGH